MNKNEPASARWTRIINEQRVSGLSIAEFCRRRSVSPPSFFNWRRRLGASGAVNNCAEATPGFVEVKVGPRDGPEADGAALELIFRGGLRVRVRRGFDHELLRDLLAALEPRLFSEALA